MARHEDEAEKVVPALSIDRRRRASVLLSPLDVAADLFVLTLERLPAADQVDRVMFCRPHQPRARLLRHAGDGPLLERGNEGILRQLLPDPDPRLNQLFVELLEFRHRLWCCGLRRLGLMVFLCQHEYTHLYLLLLNLVRATVASLMHRVARGLFDIANHRESIRCDHEEQIY